jgi:hypothetical protein
MLRGTRRRFGFARATLVAAALVALLAAGFSGPSSAVRSPKGAKPSVKILTKDQRAAINSRKISLRVGVGSAPARVRLRVLGLNLSRRPLRVVTERKVRFRTSHSRVFNVKLTKEARGLLVLARAGCRDVRISAFASGRQTPGHDSPRTTLVRHSKTLKHGRKDCGASPESPGAPGVPGSPGSTPGLGGPGLDPPGTPPPVTPPTPTDPISIKAGAAYGDSTPPVGTPMFAYTARSNVFGPSEDRPLQIIADPDENLYAKSFAPSQGLHTRIGARAIVIESGGKKYALAMIDLGGHPYTFTRAVLDRVAGLGITGDRLLLSSTHTHSSSGAIWGADNPGYAFVGGDVYDPRVFEMVVSGVAEAITEANKRLQPARIGVGIAKLKGASRNREHDPFKLNPEATPAEKASGNDAVDQQVTAIRVDDARGAPLGVWSNFAVHPTSFGDENLLFSGDNAATTERLVEDELFRDAAARGVQPKERPVNVWTNGTEGDVSPDGGVERDPSLAGNDPRATLQHATNSFGSANSAGRKVSAGVVAAWRDAASRMSGSPAIDVRHMYMTFDDTTPDGDPAAPYPALGAGGIVAGEGPSSVADGGGCSPVEEVAGPGQGKKFPIVQGLGLAPQQHPISMMRIAGLALAAWPSEVTTIVGRRMKNAIAAAAGAEAPQGVAIAGLTNSYNSYTATTEEYDFCSYEGSFTLWGRNQANYYRTLASGLAKALYGGGAMPAGGAEPAVPSPGTPNQPSVRVTPNAKSIVTDVPASVNRLGQAVFKWNGGDPAVDAPRGKPFVTLEYQPPEGGAFRAVSTEDSVLDTTQHAADDSWTETWQFTECDAVGKYRFHVRGKAVTSGPASDYETISKAFELKPAAIKSFSTTVAGGVAHVKAEYEGLPANALAALSKRVRHGVAVLRVTKPGGAVEDVLALPDSQGLEYRASVPNGSTVSVVSIEDACGNTGR